VLALVATAAPGVTLVSDEQITSDPVATDPTAEPSFNNTYQVTLAGVSAKVGDLLIGTGEEPLAGKVVAVDGSDFTMALVPLPELLPDLEFEQVIDLANAPIQVPAEIARLYDVKRTGNTFDFTPKPDFMQLVGRLPPASPAPIAAVGGLFAAGPTGTYMLPFEECETSLSSLPIALSDPPGFSMEINPSLDIAWSPDDELLHWLVRAEPKASVNVGLKINAQLEGKVECKATFFEYIIPIGGALSWFVSGKVPIGVGFELGGKVVLASATVGGKIEGKAKVALGIDCPATGNCSLVHSLDNFKVEPKWTFSAPNIGNVRLQPSFEVNGFVKAAVGNPFLQALTLDFAKAKVGGKFGADWSPRESQIADADYRSEYKLTLEAGVSIGTKLGEIAEKLGLGEIAAADVKISTDLYHSPTGKLTTDKASYAAGETVNATVKFDPPENLNILGIAYNVDRVLLVSYTGATATTIGTETVLASEPVSEGATEASVSFTTSGPLAASNIYAFVVPKYLSPADELALELERQSGPVIAFARPGKGIFTISPDGSNEAQVTTEPTDTAPALSPDGKKIAFSGIRDGSQGLFVANIDGTELKRLTQNQLRGGDPAWSPDGTKIAFSSSVTNEQGRPSVQLFVMNADGSGVQRVTTGAGGSAAGALFASWSPDGSSIAFEGLGATGTGICTVAVTGGPGTCVKLPNWPHIAAGTEPAWSPDGTLLAFDVQRASIDSQGNGVPDWNGVGTVGLGGGEPTQLVELGSSASWSPDGSQLVFVLAGDLYIVSADGSNMRQLTRTPEAEALPSWDQ
jgi:hypothetical protein